EEGEGQGHGDSAHGRAPKMHGDRAHIYNNRRIDPCECFKPIRIRKENMRILVTGGCGFIGSNFLRIVLDARKNWDLVNLDALTYAGNPENLRAVEKNPRYTFRKGSITDGTLVDDLVKSGVDAIINFAAESHVDRSLYGPTEFVQTNIQGPVTLLEAAKRHGVKRFLQISTDEVYGSLPPEGFFSETTPLHPNNPYSS